MIARNWIAANVAALALLTCPQLLSADGFTSADVLEWGESSQDTMFQTSVTMIGVVASRMPEQAQIAECVNGWYWKDAQADPERNDQIREAMQRFPTYHPQAVILAVVEKACGKF